MEPLITPPKLNEGDTVATVSLSWGGAGDMPHRYEAGVKALEAEFGFKVKAMPNSLKGDEWLYPRPQARAEDLMEAFRDPSVKAIFSNIGGDDSVRILPFLDLDVIRQNPKIFMGFSDTTISNLACTRAGLSSFNGPAVLCCFAENGGMHPYTIQAVRSMLMNNQPLGEWPVNEQGWTNQHLLWEDPSNQSIKRTLRYDAPWNFLQGSGVHQGRLWGGNLEVLEFVKGTEWWPSDPDYWDNVILFLEPSEEKPSPDFLKYVLRNYAAMGVLRRIKGLLLGRPYDNVHAQAYEAEVLRVVRNEEGLNELPIITSMDFGHSAPTWAVPYGVLAELDMDQRCVRYLESTVQ